eukprot:m.152275 g.152275  ORF g.152275 m.152275 type:complete len:658 (+) comp52849_c0_seq9:2752-4725(+)
MKPRDAIEAEALMRAISVSDLVARTACTYGARVTACVSDGKRSAMVACFCENSPSNRIVPGRFAKNGWRNGTRAERDWPPWVSPICEATSSGSGRIPCQMASCGSRSSRSRALAKSSFPPPVVSRRMALGSSLQPDRYVKFEFARKGYATSGPEYLMAPAAIRTSERGGRACARASRLAAYSLVDTESVESRQWDAGRAGTRLRIDALPVVKVGRRVDARHTRANILLLPWEVMGLGANLLRPVRWAAHSTCGVRRGPTRWGGRCLAASPRPAARRPERPLTQTDCANRSNPCTLSRISRTCSGIADGMDLEAGCPHTFASFDEAEAAGVYVPRAVESFVYVLLATIFLTVARTAFNRFIATPIGLYFHVSDRRPPAPDQDSTLEALYRGTKGKFTEKHAQHAAEASGKPLKYVYRWFRLRRALGQPTLLDKMNDALWRVALFTFTTLYAYFMLRDQPWFQDTNLCWVGLPVHDMPVDLRIFYYLKFGFFAALLASIDSKRKDYAEMMLHHLATIGLIVTSWASGMYRIAALILFLHDISDIFLEAAKIGLYLKKKGLADISFALFAIVFAVSRLYYYPVIAVRSVAIEWVNILGIYPSWYPNMVMLLTLQALHIFWFSLILKLIYKAVVSGAVEDPRSDDDSQDLIEEEDRRVKSK